jgi:hypothetical protein
MMTSMDSSEDSPTRSSSATADESAGNVLAPEIATRPALTAWSFMPYIPQIREDISG